MGKSLAKKAASPSTTSAPANAADDKKTHTTASFGEIGSSGLRRWGGFVDDEFLRELKGIKGVKTYREMLDNDDICGAAIQILVTLGQSADFKFKTSRTDDVGAQQVQFLSECLSDMEGTWKDTLGDILTMFGYGWSALEIVLKVRDGNQDPESLYDSLPPSVAGAPVLTVLPGSAGFATGSTPLAPLPSTSNYKDGKIGIRKLALRAQETLYRWNFDATGAVRHLVQRDPVTTQEAWIPIGKLLHFRTKTEKNNPEGRSLLRSAYRPWYFKKNIQTVEGIGIERELAGMPLISVDTSDEGHAPDLWNPDDADGARLLQMLEQIVKSVRADDQMGLVLPKWAEFSLAGGTGRRAIDTNAIVTRYDTRIAMTIAMDFMLLGHDAVGSKALATSKTDIFGKGLRGWLDRVCDVINRFLVPKLMRLNGWLEGPYPEFIVGNTTTVDLPSLGDFILKLSQAGMVIFPNRTIESALMRAAELPVTTADGSEEIPGTSDLEDEAMTREALRQHQLQPSVVVAPAQPGAPGTAAADTPKPVATPAPAAVDTKTPPIAPGGRDASTRKVQRSRHRL